MAEIAGADYADRLADNGWCLRSALVRFAQPEPLLATQIHELMRRLDSALVMQAKTGSGQPSVFADAFSEYSTLAKSMTQWAGSPRTVEIPTDSAHNQVIALGQIYDRLGVGPEELPPQGARPLRTSEGRRRSKPKTDQPESPAGEVSPLA